jgi:hypothetical protein
MSTWNEHDEKIEVTIEASHPATEIFVIDGNFNLVDRGLDRLKTRLLPGLYKIKFKTGSMIKEIHQVIEPSSDSIRVTGPEMRFSTSAPLSQTRTIHDYHQYPVTRLSQEISRRLGQGSQFFFFGRDLESGPPKNVALGLSLVNLANETLLDLSRQGDHNAEQGWAGCTVEVDPGVYRLRLQVGQDITLEQTLVASPGWQTQIFWLRRNYGPGRPMRRVDLDTASILMAPLGRGFDPNREDLRTTDLARLGLVNRRAVVSPADLRQMLWEKFENPMLGLLGAHLLLLSTEPDLPLLRIVVTNLRRLLGQHPDIEALALRLGETVPAFSIPPMLRNSWQLIVQASATKPDLVPMGSLAAQMADRLWGDGAWLVWERPPVEAVKVEEITVKGSLNLQQALTQVTQIVGDREMLTAILEHGNLTDVEESLLRYALKGSQPMPKSAMEALSTPSPSSLPGTETNLVRTLGLPYAAVQQSLAGLNQKMEQMVERGVITQRSVQVGGDRSVIGSKAGGSIIAGERNVIIRNVKVPRHQPEQSRNQLQADLEELDQTIADLRKHLSGPALDAALKELLEKRAALEVELGSQGTVITEDSIQFGGEGSVIGSVAENDIITGSDNQITETHDSDVDDD